MRLWSIHPKYLDCKGLVAVWREGLLAKKALEGKVKGYVNHPQLFRFKCYGRPLDLIDAYLFQIYLEAKERDYYFDLSKIRGIELLGVVTVTDGQLRYEFIHLLKKVERRDRKKFDDLKNVDVRKVEPNPIFKVINGDIESWERRSL
ncbi:MAG: pyrimidine dimer DNA glycosylase/endonuclease V [Candidatus Methanomethylicaceae archaeon]|nr:pyrimidine dimer DNA glycosylase/endonuclease V [Candidatus Verstraetearchaeota archaeon]